ncbi:hypothetical protein N7931_12295 [Catenovulum sp. 2E275]|uniref:hypothetical protein n=1 Tax=Catenovulum sp. 2E275 TaxID=2980497 RepID=UPI0021D08876|nr:hypothetical protein [Catenovulum sp. 2E275]MCU4676409.1 hypothetical protein [Catenovulum sp. 2E275]
MKTTIINPLTALSLAFIAPNLLAQTEQHTQPQHKKTYQLEFILDSFSYSEVMPVIETFGGVIPVARIGRESSYSDEPEAGRQALTHNRAHLRAGWQNWFFQLSARYDYNIEFTPDAAQLFFLDRNERPVDKNDYQLKFSANHVRANGIGLGYRWQYQDLTLTVSANYWDVEHMENGNINGVFHANQQDDSFEVTGDIDYNYFKDALLDRANCEVSDPPVAGCYGRWQTDGHGFNLDMQFSYQISDSWRFDANIYDVYSRFNYQKVGKTIGRLNTQNEQFNPDGSFTINPSFSGEYADGKFSQSVSTQAQLRLSAELLVPVWAEVYAANDTNYPSIGIGQTWFNTRFELGYQAKTEAFMFRAKHDYINFALASETTNFEQAKALVFSLGINYAW